MLPRRPSAIVSQAFCWLLVIGLAGLSPITLAATIPTVVTRQLANGQTLYVVENHQQPVVTIDTWVDVGSVNETANNNGVSHFLEHLLFKGTPQWPTGSIDRWLDSKGAGYNAATSQDFTHYYITVARPFFEQAVGIQAQMLRQSDFPVAEVDHERLVVQEEINRARNTPGHRLYEALQRVLYPGHPYAQSTLGPKTVIASIPRQSILEYWCRWYRPEHLKTIVVGDITPDEAQSAVSKAFNEAASSCATSPASTEPMIADIPMLKEPVVEVLADPGVRQTYAMLAFAAPPAQDWQASVALDAALDALGGGRSSRLYRRLRNQEQLVQDISASNLTQRHGGAIIVSFETSPEKVQPAVKAILEEIARFNQEGLTAEELASYQHKTAKSFIFQSEKTDDLANAIGYNVTIGSLKDYTEYLSRLEGLTPEKVSTQSRRWLKVQQAALVAVVPQGSEATPAVNSAPWLELLKTAAQQPDTLTPEATNGPSATELLAATQPVLTGKTLPNGLRLITKKLPQSRTVSLQLVVRGGQRTEGKPGTAALLARLLNAGPKTRTEADWHKLLESRGLSIAATAGKDEWALSATSTREDFEGLLLTLRELLDQPALSPTVFDREKALFTRDVAANEDEPLTLALEKAALALYPAHPYGNLGTRLLSALPGVTRDNVVDYFHRSFQPGNISAVVAGDVDPVAVQTFLTDLPYPSKSATASSPKNARPSNRIALKPASTKSVLTGQLTKSQLIETRKPEQAATWMVQGWLVPPAPAGDYASLKVLSTLLGGGMSSRLFVELREKQGLAYSVGSQYGGTHDAGIFILYIGTDPKNEAAVREGFAQQVNRILQGDITAEQLQAAKDQLTGKFALAHETPADHAQYLGTYESLGLGYGFDERFPDTVAKVTLNDVVRVAKTYLSRRSITSLVGPVAINTATPEPARTQGP